ncbi:helix-turn-helix domain-containing protein [Rhizobium lusitanum]|uniref:helix-turn-helix domain-containing protein n=1 Tax=Rhizobium lusitanum TaxID=293958 RepID=UPI0025747F70|nr:helix-turn-helix domain-containing protein [Rhizobium lusitanum]
MGDEIAHILAGRVRLRLPQHTQIFEAGETAVVPGGIIHRFEAVDREGWAFSSNFVSSSSPPDLRAFLSARFNGRFLEYVCNALFLRETLHTDVDAIARNCSLSAGYLSRVFQRATGTGIHNYHVLVALQKSKDLLREQRPIVCAANEAGFCDQAHLTREFVKTLGMTPSIFREAWV